MFVGANNVGKSTALVQNHQMMWQTGGWLGLTVRGSVPRFVLDELSVQCTSKAPGDPVFPGPDGGYLPRRSRRAGGSPER